jgi:2-polyprenyl-3-methyl-5-hydroxy-6-metoxy-1,4-benzoquinol methylase
MKDTSYYRKDRAEIAYFIPSDIKTLLDVGCGQGSFLNLVKEHTGAETWGIEVESQVAEKAKNKTDNIITGKVEDVITSIPDSYFDCITFNDILEHLIEPGETLNMIKQKLSPNGIIIASIPNVRYYANLYELLIKRDWKYIDKGILDSTHLRFYTKKSMRRLFEQEGYVLTAQIGINKSKSWKSLVFQILTFGVFSDTKFTQFICIGKA